MPLSAFCKHPVVSIVTTVHASLSTVDAFALAPPPKHFLYCIFTHTETLDLLGWLLTESWGAKILFLSVHRTRLLKI